MKTDLLTILKIAGSVGLSHGTCQWILSEDLNMQQISAKLMPWLISDKQKQQQFLAARNVAVVSHPPCLQMWLFVVLSCFQKWNLIYRRVISRISLKCRNNCWLSYMWFQKVGSNIASSSSRNTGPSALTHKVTVLRSRGLWPTTKVGVYISI